MILGGSFQWAEGWGLMNWNHHRISETRNVMWRNTFKCTWRPFQWMSLDWPGKIAAIPSTWIPAPLPSWPPRPYSPTTAPFSRLHWDGHPFHWELVCPLSPDQPPFSLTSPYNALYCLYWILAPYLSAFSSQLSPETVYLFPQLPAQFLAHIFSSVSVCVHGHTYTMQAKTLVPILALSLTWAHQLINCLFPHLFCAVHLITNPQAQVFIAYLDCP